MHVSAGHQGSEAVVNQEESNGKLPPCVHCQESDNGSLSSPSRPTVDTKSKCCIVYIYQMCLLEIIALICT